MFYYDTTNDEYEAPIEFEEFDVDIEFGDGDGSQAWDENPEPFEYQDQVFENEYAQYELRRKFMFIAITVVIAVVGLAQYTFSGKASGASLAIISEQADQPTQVIEITPTVASNPAPRSGNIINLECVVSERYPNSIRQWCDLIVDNANKRGLPPDLVAALIWQESGGNPNAYSQSGAVGLMQIMPRDGLAASFMCANGPCFHDRPYSDELKDPAFNISYGTKMLAGLVKRNGNLRDALKSYGPMNVGYYYADKVLGIYQRYGN